MLRICLLHSVLLLLGVPHGRACCALCSLVRLLIARVKHVENRVGEIISYPFSYLGTAWSDSTRSCCHLSVKR